MALVIVLYLREEIIVASDSQLTLNETRRKGELSRAVKDAIKKYIST